MSITVCIQITFQKSFLLLDNDSKYDSEVAWQFSEGAIAEAVNIVFRPVQTPEILKTCGVFAYVL